MEKLTVEQFSKKLNPKNEISKQLIELASGYFLDRHSVVCVKRSDLLEVVQKMIDINLFPIVDKKLQVVIGLEDGSHNYVLALLQEYHELNVNPESDGTTREYMRNYLEEGNGYYIGSMRPEHIVSGVEYRPDRFDKDLFTTFKTIFAF